MTQQITQTIADALQKRRGLFQSNSAADAGALRLFNGFYEGLPEISLDVYAGTLVIQYFGKKECPDQALIDQVLAAVSAELPDLDCVLVKSRFSTNEENRRGTILKGEKPAEWITEWGIKYAIDLQINQDSGFYLDCSLLRQWLLQHCLDKQVLNTFAYTGSLGIAALTGGAAQVVQTDINGTFLTQADKSIAANYLSSENISSIAGDFFQVTAAMRREKRLFDIIILDPPVFSKTRGGIVDIQRNYPALINKIRPLAADGGIIVAINNALYLSGADYLSQLHQSTEDGYIQVGESIPVPQSFFGFSEKLSHLPADPTPFNHPTKINLLHVTRKDGKKSS